MDMVQDLIAKGKAAIDQAKFITNPTGTDKTNIINRIGERLGIDFLSMDEPEVFEELKNYLNMKLSNKVSPTKDVDFVTEALNEALKLNEATNEAIPSSKNILRYEDSDVEKTIKDVIETKFKNFTIEKIVGDEGGAFWNVILTTHIEDVQDNIEANRFVLAKNMGEFKSEFLSEISMILPVINITNGSFQYTKNSDKLRFVSTICLSHTNDREWVSGKMKKTDSKKLDKIVAKESVENAKDEIKENTRHIVKPISLQTAIKAFKNKKIDRKMFETALKAANRAELETFVMSNIAGIDISKPSANANEGPKEEKGDDKEIKEGIAKMKSNFVVRNEVEPFDVVDQLRKLGMEASVVDQHKIYVKWNPSKFSSAQIQDIANGNF